MPYFFVFKYCVLKYGLESSKNARKSTSEGIRHILNETDTMADHAGIVQPLEPDNEDQAHILRSPGDAVADKMPKPDDPNEKKLFRLISVINRLSITHIPIISSPGLDAVSLVLDAASLPTTAGTSGTDETLLSPASNLDLYYLSRIAAKSAALDTVLYSVIISLLQRPDALLKEIPYDQCRTFDSTPYGPERTCSLLTKGKACNLKFGRGDRFKHHIQQHLGIRPYPCAGSKTVHPWCVLFIHYSCKVFLIVLPVTYPSAALRLETTMYATRIKSAVYGN